MSISTWHAICIRHLHADMSSEHFVSCNRFFDAHSIRRRSNCISSPESQSLAKAGHGPRSLPPSLSLSVFPAPSLSLPPSIRYIHTSREAKYSCRLCCSSRPLWTALLIRELNTLELPPSTPSGSPRLCVFHVCVCVRVRVCVAKLLGG